MVPSRSVAAAGFDRPRQAPRDAEVEQLDHAVIADDDVVRLDVAVHQARAMRRRQRARHVAEPAQPLAHAHRCVADVLAQRPPAHQLHGDERRALELADVEDRHRVRVRERRRRARLAQHAPRRLFRRYRAVAGDREHLERHRAAELLVDGAIDPPHAAAPEQTLDAIAAGDDAPRFELARRPRRRHQTSSSVTPSSLAGASCSMAARSERDEVERDQAVNKTPSAESSIRFTSAAPSTGGVSMTM